MTPTQRSVLAAVVLFSGLGGAFTAACSSDSTPVNPGSDAGGRPDATAADTGTTPDTGNPQPDAANDAANEAATDAGCAAYTGAVPSDAGATCHDLVNSAPRINLTAGSGTMPVGTGGVLGDGLYHMTELRTYPTSPIADAGITVKLTVLVVGDITYTVNDNSNETGTVRKTTRKNPDGGAGIELCSTKGTDPEATSSTATCNSLTTYDSNFQFSATLTKQ